MAPEEVFLAGLLVSMFIGSVGYLVSKFEKKRKAQRLRKLGKDNAYEAKVQAELMCIECKTPTRPDQGGIFDNGAWWCASCWKKVVQ